MRTIRLLLITFLTIVWILILLAYFAVQTNYGAKFISQQLSKLSSYSISIGKVNHSLANFYEISVEDLTIKDENQHVTKIAKLIIGFDKNDLWQLKHFNYIVVVNGELDGSKIEQASISANVLKLVDSTVNVSLNDGKDSLTFRQINGGIKPFNVSDQQSYQFELSSQQVSFNHFLVDKVLLQGFQREGTIYITNLGGNINDGFFVSKLKILADKSLDVEQLKLNNIHVQSKDNQYFAQYLDKLPKTTFRQLSMLNSSIQLPDYTIEKGNIETTNIIYDKQWQFNQSALVFNADNIVWNEKPFSSVLLQLMLKNEHNVVIEKAIGIWNQGRLSLNGDWKDNNLHIDKLLVTEIDFKLPKKIEQIVLPESLKQIDIDRLSILKGGIINTNPDYPFNFVDFQASGSKLRLVENRKLGLFNGQLFVKANNGTVNKIGMIYPDFSVKFNEQHQALLAFTALVNGGMLESNAIVNPSLDKLESLHLKAYGVSSIFLEKWKLVKQLPNASHYTLDLHGEIAPYSLSGTFFANGNRYNIEPQH